MGADLFSPAPRPSAPSPSSAPAPHAHPACAPAPRTPALTLPPLLFLLLGNLLKVTEGEHAGKLCLLDFGLVAEVPPADREAMVSATIHLANRDWPALIDDFVALEFLPANCDRGVIIPVMDRVLSPYLRGGGAKSFNFQVRGEHVHVLVGLAGESGAWDALGGRFDGGPGPSAVLSLPSPFSARARAWCATCA